MPDDEELREELAKVIDGLRLTSPAHAGVVADHLLPVVEQYAARRAAEALRDAAKVISAVTPYGARTRVMLAARADALTAEASNRHPAHRHDETGAGR